MAKNVQDLKGETLISIGEMSRKSGVSASAIRGYEIMGLLAQYGITVIRSGNYRYFSKDDAMKLAQIKADRLTERNLKLSLQGQR